MEPTTGKPVPRVTAMHVRTLLDSSAVHPVLYISYGEDSEAELDVWGGGLVDQAHIVLTRAAAVELFGEEPDDESVATSLPKVQQAVDQLVSTRDE
ncbi:hypothetical protein ACEZCY_36835 [Streptacidiphilus sp. N1-12]|uniref:Uncharacterized protein n=2 Tax=Streptacidiphilus alkalitolerans TaxID=3342712 RepID=A0ABV6VMA1_9ACTN